MTTLRTVAAPPPADRFFGLPSRAKAVLRGAFRRCFAAPSQQQLWTYFLPNRQERRQQAN